MPKVRIVKDGVKGADDGATVRAYAKDKIYTVSDALAEVFIEAGEAEEVAEEKQSVTDKVKAKKGTAGGSTGEPEPSAPEPPAVPVPEPVTPEPAAPEIPAAVAPTALPGLPKASDKK